MRLSTRAPYNITFTFWLHQDILKQRSNLSKRKIWRNIHHQRVNIISEDENEIGLAIMRKII